MTAATSRADIEGPSARTSLQRGRDRLLDAKDVGAPLQGALDRVRPARDPDPEFRIEIEASRRLDRERRDRPVGYGQVLDFPPRQALAIDEDQASIVKTKRSPITLKATRTG